ncbi:hypothetical protein BKA56DRAFT_568132 [Ilyonectria sp. MPI-CAGE-AT-0026]|nr:hypothetical protein BKA56DRAFT_568132 [Ilyonectria sp. MPI-CAGE-AT-0026]
MASSSTQIVRLERPSLHSHSLLTSFPALPYPRETWVCKEVQDDEDFFARNGFDNHAKEACHVFAQTTYPDIEITPVRPQGYCSYTLAISTTHLLQFRSDTYQLDLKVCEEARMVFGSLVPRVQFIGYVPDCHTVDGERRLHVYIQERIPGVTLKEFQKMEMLNDERRRQCRRHLVVDLAEMFAIGLHHGRPGIHASEDETFKKGQIGSSLRWRLNLLKTLSESFLLDTVSDVASRIGHIEGLPWCLTHGDLVPANIMVDPSTGHLTGLIDWAEGEWLPFGVGLYGLEEVLGSEDAQAGFRFFEDHEQLRAVFWNKLLELTATRDAESLSWVQDAGLAQKLGILLWRGIAFEDGRIDRVVETGRDDIELQKLRLFLEASSQSRVMTDDQN